MRLKLQGTEKKWQCRIIARQATVVLESVISNALLRGNL